MVELGAKGEKTGELVFNGNTVSVWKIKKFWRCMVVVVAYQCGIYLIPVSCTHK
jgi:hypothetical protein